MNKKQSRVLIVEDEKDISQILEMMLGEYFSEIIIAYNGREGLKITREVKDLSCVVSDLDMPVMDGIQMIKNIRKDGNKVPVIFFTGNGTDSAMKEALKHGVFDFIQKPDFDNLEKIVRKAVDSNSEEKNDINENFMNDLKKRLENFWKASL